MSTTAQTGIRSRGPETNDQHPALINATDKDSRDFVSSSHVETSPTNLSFSNISLNPYPRCLEPHIDAGIIVNGQCYLRVPQQLPASIVDAAERMERAYLYMDL